MERRKGLKRTGIERHPERGNGLARGDGLERTGGLERGPGPTINPDNVRAWLNRSRKTAHANRRRATPREAVEAARVRSKGRCIVCGAKEQDPRRWPHHPHHVFPVGGTITPFPELEGEPWNIVLLCPGCHDNHERAHVRIPRAKLPPETIALAAGIPAREIYLEDTYP